MKINLEKLHSHIETGVVGRHGIWSPSSKVRPVFYAVTGARTFAESRETGWPDWLQDLCSMFIHWAPPAFWKEWAITLITTIKEARDRGVDFNLVYQTYRNEVIYPMALAAIGEGFEPWFPEVEAAILNVQKNQNNWHCLEALWTLEQDKELRTTGVNGTLLAAADTHAAGTQAAIFTLAHTWDFRRALFTHAKEQLLRILEDA
jgi:hypothetical protein